MRSIWWLHEPTYYGTVILVTLYIYYFHVDNQLRMLETLLNHFVDLVQQRNVLLQRIKKSRNGVHLKIEAVFQKYVSTNTWYWSILNYLIRIIAILLVVDSNWKHGLYDALISNQKCGSCTPGFLKLLVIVMHTCVFVCS